MYMKLLVQLYRFLARRIASPFPKTILKRLLLSKVNRPPISLRQIIQNTKGKEGKIVVTISTVTNDTTLLEIPKLKICALKFTREARERILAVGGECLTLDTIAKKDPTGASCVMLRGPKNRYTHFGKAPGTPRGTAKPLCRIKNGRKAERLKRRK